MILEVWRRDDPARALLEGRKPCRRGGDGSGCGPTGRQGQEPGGKEREPGNDWLSAVPGFSHRTGIPSTAMEVGYGKLRLPNWLPDTFDWAVHGFPRMLRIDTDCKPEISFLLLLPVQWDTDGHGWYGFSRILIPSSREAPSGRGPRGRGLWAMPCSSVNPVGIHVLISNYQVARAPKIALSASSAIGFFIEFIGN